MTRNYCITSGVLFSFVALVHVWRLVLGFPILIGVWSVPLSLSAVGGIVAGCFAVWAFRSAKGTKAVTVAYT